MDASVVYHWSGRQQNPDHIKFQDAQKLLSSVSPLKEKSRQTEHGMGYRRDRLID